MASRRKKVGIMGGTFDPIHLGHLILGERAYEQLALDTVWFMPSGNPPHKVGRIGRASDEERVEMVRRAIADNPHFELSQLEMNEEGYTYTFRTLETLTRENPDTDYYFIIGADSLYDFDGWMEPQRICNCCTLVVATRNHTPLPELQQKMNEVAERYHAKLVRLDTMNVDIASSMLRHWVKNSQSLKYYVPDSVISYIHEHQIYYSKEEAVDASVGKD